MINLYKSVNNKLVLEELNIDNKEAEKSSLSALKDALWLDLIDIKSNERRYIQESLNLELARNIELEDIEASARFFEEDGSLHLHSFFYCEDNDSYPDLESVAFSISREKIITLRSRDLPTFRLFRLRNRNAPPIEQNPYKILLDLLELKIEQLADILENAYSDIERIGRNTLRMDKNENLQLTLNDLANYEDVASKVQLSLMDTQRALSYLVRKGNLLVPELEQARGILRDIDSLKPNNDNLFQRLDFLMQATLGKINIEQNKIIKMFSVVSVIFLPPTLVASIYGMNFSLMPELNLKYGYPFALIFMLISAIAPLLYFKYKKWL